MGDGMRDHGKREGRGKMDGKISGDEKRREWEGEERKREGNNGRRTWGEKRREEEIL